MKMRINFLIFALIYYSNGENGYIINTSKCKIPDIDPFNEDTLALFQSQNYTECAQHELLTFVVKKNNTAYLGIKESLIPSYTKGGIKCCYSSISRKGTPNNPDYGIKISKCRNFTGKAAIKSNFVKVECLNEDNRLVYENVHNALTINDRMKEKIVSGSKAISVLLVVVDSVSRLNLMRTMPATRDYLLNNGFIEFKGYNKVNDNTFPNFMAFLTGFNLTQTYKTCNPRDLTGMDDCPMIWYDYRNLGYVTGFAEDHIALSTFSYSTRGFVKPPTDFYFKPYIEASERLNVVEKDGMPYCTGPENAGERILDLAKDFAVTLKPMPSFGVFWLNSFHNRLNAPTRMDGRMRRFFSDLKEEQILDDSIVVFMSDHGFRFGDIRLSKSGWFEERLPLFLASLPPWFKMRFPNEHANFVENSNKLTTPYDLYMTLQHVLTLSELEYEARPSGACPKCKSLFKAVSQKRSCSDAGITPEWCTCIGHLRPVNATVKHVQDAIKFVLLKVANLLEAKAPGKCAKFALDQVITSSLSDVVDYSRSRYLYITFVTKPHAEFLATIKFRKNIENTSIFQLIRFDSYAINSQCVSRSLKKMCYCLNND